VAFTLRIGARLSLFPSCDRTFHDAAGFALCYGPLGCSPYRAFDAGLRPRELPLEDASLLRGRLAATPTGLTPASNDEHDQSSTAHTINLRSSGRTPQERELGVLVRGTPPFVLAVHDPGLVGMQPQPDLFHPRADRGQHSSCLPLTNAVHHRVIRVAFELHTRKLPGHPRIKRIVQEHCATKATCRIPDSVGRNSEGGSWA
jgi:hypothetical protein